jgi:N-methylhydantoinase A/oxoprolinase/acetone carboxylase beta subunit
MSRYLVGIDVGGTHTDGVVVDRHTGEVLHKAKVATTTNLEQCSLAVLNELANEIGVGDILRIVLSTTKITNAIATGRLEPVAMLLMAGPGLDPHLLSTDPYCKVVAGQIDHRGRQVRPIDEEEVRLRLDAFSAKGISVLAVAGKFSVRNPDHEEGVAKIAADRFDHVSVSHRLDGSLNFPRRASTAYLAAAVWRLHANFTRSLQEAVTKMGIGAPLYLLRADGGAQLASSFDNPAEAALSGPAASIMGILATGATGNLAATNGSGETLGLDIGGTTTDLSLFVGNAPLLEYSGATIGEFITQIRALYTRSIAVGGDSTLTVRDGVLYVGPERLGPAAAYGGPAPTPTDALVVLNRAPGDRERAVAALTPLAHELGLEVPELASRALKLLSKTIAKAAAELVTEVNSKHVYTIHDLLEGHKVKPDAAIAVGGPASAIATYLEEALSLPVNAPDNFEVANAVGAAVASLSLEVNALADTAEGKLTIPKAGVNRSIDASYRFEDLQEETEAALAGLAAERDSVPGEMEVDVAMKESFSVIEGYNRVGRIHRLRLRVRPSILCQARTQR